MAETFPATPGEFGPEAYRFDELVEGVLDRRGEAKRMDEQLYPVERGPSLRFLMHSYIDTEFVPAPNDRICLVPPKQGESIGGVTSVKFYIPIDIDRPQETLIRNKGLYTSVRRNGVQTTRFFIDGEGATQHVEMFYPNDDENENRRDEFNPELRPDEAAKELIETLILITQNYALEAQQKKDSDQRT